MSNPIQNNRIHDLIQSRPVSQRQTPSQVDKSASNDFQAILSDRLKLSNHAKTRLQSRELELDQDRWQRVLDGVDKAAAKGSKESLVMVDDVALVVSVKNRTVITAVGQDHLKENVFTNIDSAVIV